MMLSTLTLVVKCASQKLFRPCGTAYSRGSYGRPNQDQAAACLWPVVFELVGEATAKLRQRLACRGRHICKVLGDGMGIGIDNLQHWARERAGGSSGPTTGLGRRRTLSDLFPGLRGPLILAVTWRPILWNHFPAPR